MMATKVSKLLEEFNKLFIVPKRVKFIDDKSPNIKRFESELRITKGEKFNLYTFHAKEYM